MNKVLGLIAGQGKLPALLLDGAKAKGFRVAVCAIRGEADPALLEKADASRWVRVGELGSLRNFFKSEKVTQTVMGGKIRKANLFRGEIRPDFEMIKVLAKTKNHSDDSLLGGIADYLADQGMVLVPTTHFLSEETLPAPGILTRKKPSKKDSLDIDYGWQLAKGMGRLDIGQTVVVKNQAVLAVEAIEGTDEAIKRGGALGSGGVTVVKTAKPNQDFRFDVPAVGLATLKALIEVRARTLAIEARKTILLDRDEFMDRANQYGLIVVSKEI